MTWFSSTEGNKCLWHNMDVMHAVLHAEISMKETVKEKKKKMRSVEKEDAKTKYVSSWIEGR